MIVKFARRGKGGGSGPVEYLLGKEREREGATLNRGNPDQVKALIDSSPYAKKYTTGYLSFEEQNLPTETKERLMSEFQEALLPGLEPDQYSILWVEHVDKGRLELNFVVPNIELQTGKRLQPYFHKADNPRIDAWRTAKNIELGLHDPDDPANRQALVQASDLPPESKKVGELITNGLLQMASSGHIKSREDVIAALESKGFEIARITEKSISIKHPEEGRRNIRLKGLLYEQNFRFGEGLQRAIEEASELHRSTAQARLQEARRTYTSCFERKRAENKKRHRRPPRNDLSISQMALDYAGNSSALVVADSSSNLDIPRRADHRTARSNNAARPNSQRELGDNIQAGKNDSSLLQRDRTVRKRLSVAETGLKENDRVRNPIIERIRAVTDSARTFAERSARKGREFCSALQQFSRSVQDESEREQRLEKPSQQIGRVYAAVQQANFAISGSSCELDAAAPAIRKALQREQSIGFNRDVDDRGMSL